MDGMRLEKLGMLGVLLFEVITQPVQRLSMPKTHGQIHVYFWLTDELVIFLLVEISALVSLTKLFRITITFREPRVGSGRLLWFDEFCLNWLFGELCVCWVSGSLW